MMGREKHHKHMSKNMKGVNKLEETLPISIIFIFGWHSGLGSSEKRHFDHA